MEDLVPAEVDILVLLSRNFVRVCVVDIVELASFISVDFDIFRQKEDTAPAPCSCHPGRSVRRRCPRGAGESSAFPRIQRMSSPGWAGGTKSCTADDPSPFLCFRYRPSPGTDAAAVPQWTPPADGHRHTQSGSAWRLSHPPAPRHWNVKHKGLPGIADIIRYLRQTFFFSGCSVLGESLGFSNPIHSQNPIKYSLFLFQNFISQS